MKYGCLQGTWARSEQNLPNSCVSTHPLSLFLEVISLVVVQLMDSDGILKDLCLHLKTWQIDLHRCFIGSWRSLNPALADIQWIIISIAAQLLFHQGQWRIFNLPLLVFNQV
jgi:hypothetical protein